jgi:sec-independent protein translocase protein TatB
VFGFSFSELVVLIVVAVVVIGPKDLPKVLRKLGQYAGKARRMAADLRAQSGIDDVLRGEGLSESVQEIRKLARGEIADLDRSVRYDGAEAKLENQAVETRALRDREYPRDGADAFGALPDTALVYEGTLPKSDLAKDPLWVMGDKDAIIPPEPEPEPEPVAASTEAEADAPKPETSEKPETPETPEEPADEAAHARGAGSA